MHSRFALTIISSRRPEDVTSGWRRVQCRVVGPVSSPEEQTGMSAVYQQQIINHLQINNFSIPGTELASCEQDKIFVHVATFLIFCSGWFL